MTGTSLPNRLPNRHARVVALALVCAACGDGVSLEGSLGDEVGLAFTAVSVEVTASEVAILYTKDVPGSSTPDQVLKVTADTTGLALTGPLTIDLTEKVANKTRGAVSRAVSGDPRRVFPALLRGSMTFSQAPTAGAQVSGSFTVTFSPTGGSLGAGKTAFGDSKATVKKVG